MSSHAGYIGAEEPSYPETAARAVDGVHQQNPSPVYGYLRAGTQQKIYLFQTTRDANEWITTLLRTQAQPYDYAAVFVATDLAKPVPGLESFGSAHMSGAAHVGSLWPLLFGLPVGALGGYYLRKWQEEHPGQMVPGVPPSKLPAPNMPTPKLAGDWVGGPWLDLVGQIYDGYDADDGADDDADDGADDDADYTVGGPWLDLIGAQVENRGRSRAWPQTKALIQSAISEVTDAASTAPAEAYVWSLDLPSESSSPQIVLEGTTTVASFPSIAEALDYMRARIQTPHVALALFDRRSAHWPNPTNWTKSNDPAHDFVVEQHLARATSRTAGDYVGADSRPTALGSALNDVRSRAQTIATKREGTAIGVIHTVKDGLWHAYAFHNPDDADDWLGTATQDPASYTYAAYYDKKDYLWPHPANEKIGGPARARSGPLSVSRVVES